MYVLFCATLSKNGLNIDKSGSDERQMKHK